MFTDRQKQLTDELIRASELYYSGAPSIMSDIEFDRKIEELKELEKESGIILDNSPTAKVGAQAVNILSKSKHEYPALSLGKIKYKERENIFKWLETVDNSALVSLKMDGLTVVVTYINGEMVKAVTRGDGRVGSDVTHNARYFKGLPSKIDYKGKLIVRGEATMSVEEFERVNLLAGDIYENPRNLASATIQMLDPNESRQREIWFTAFEVANSIDENFTYDEEIEFLKKQDINSVEYELVSASNVMSVIERWKEKVSSFNHPTDGLVFRARSNLRFKELGSTGSHPRGAVALKWTDETSTTVIRNIEWSVGRTGIVTPVAIFDSVRLGLGSNVTRASLHNLTIMSRVPDISGLSNGVKIGSKAEVYLANAIIPQIANVDNSGDVIDIEIPNTCPVCGQELNIKSDNGIEVLICNNDECGAQKIGQLMNSFSNNGMNIKGLGQKQVEDLIDVGLTNTNLLSYYEMYEKYKDVKGIPEELKDRDGWGDKKWNNALKSIEESRETTLQNFIYSLNIPMVAKTTAKVISEYLDNSIDLFLKVVNDDSLFMEFLSYLQGLEGVGKVRSINVYKWWSKLKEKDKIKDLNRLADLLIFKETEVTKDGSLKGMVFVITGKLFNYSNRDELKNSIENRGGK